MKNFEVPIVYRGQSYYIVGAETKEKAEEIARERFMDSKKGDIPIIEEEVIHSIGNIEEFWACPYCNSTKGTWFSRIMPMSNVCENCGKDVD